MIFLRTEDGAEKCALRDLRLAEEMSVPITGSLRERVGNVSEAEADRR